MTVAAAYIRRRSKDRLNADFDEKKAVTVIEITVEDDDNRQQANSAHINKDGSINLSLNALPLKGKLHVREPTVTLEA